MGSAPSNDQVYTTVAAVLVPLFLVIAVVIGCVMWRHRNSLGGAVVYKDRMAAYVYKHGRDVVTFTYPYSLLVFWCELYRV